MNGFMVLLDDVDGVDVVGVVDVVDVVDVVYDFGLMAVPDEGIGRGSVS
jgi:hypothetical protein